MQCSPFQALNILSLIPLITMELLKIQLVIEKIMFICSDYQSLTLVFMKKLGAELFV